MCTASTRNCVPPMRASTSFLRNVTDRARRHGLQRGVTGLEAVALVQLLHVADSDEERVHRRVLAVRELQQLRPGRDQPAPVLEPGQLVAPGQLQDPRAELLELALNGQPSRQIAQDATRLGHPGLVAELHRCQLDLHVAAVAAAEAGHADGRAGPFPLGHGDAPAWVLLVDQPVPSEGADGVGAHVEHGAGGRVGGRDLALLVTEEHPLGAVREQHSAAGQADRPCSLNHHAARPFSGARLPPGAHRLADENIECHS